MLKNIDRKGYPAYKGTSGIYDFGNYFLQIDHVQGDPFASPSKLSIKIKGKKQDSLPNFIIKNVNVLLFVTI